MRKLVNIPIAPGMRATGTPRQLIRWCWWAWRGRVLLEAEMGWAKRLGREARKHGKPAE